MPIPAVTIWKPNHGSSSIILYLWFMISSRWVKSLLSVLVQGTCENLTYEEIATKFPNEFNLREGDKYFYRYPFGEVRNNQCHVLQLFKIFLILGKGLHYISSLNNSNFTSELEYYLLWHNCSNFLFEPQYQFMLTLTSECFIYFYFILSNSSHSSVKMQRIKIHAGLQTMKYERI